MASTLIPKLKAEIEALEAQYQAAEDRIERSGGVDYRGELVALRRKLDDKRHKLEMWSKLWQAAESNSRTNAAKLMVEVLLADDDVDTIEDIAADFVEDIGVGRHDWMTNWALLQDKGEALPRVQAYLDEYGIAADAQKVVHFIDHMLVKRPGRWK